MRPEADKPPSIDDLARAFLRLRPLTVGPGLADLQMAHARQEVLNLQARQTEEAAQRSPPCPRSVTHPAARCRSWSGGRPD